jgi:hypothetical protein
VILLNGSKSASAIVANSEYDNDVVAPYVCNTAKIQFITKLPLTAILTSLSAETLSHGRQWAGAYLKGIICQFGVGIETVLIDAFEHAFDHGILRLVEFTDFASNAAAAEELVFGDEFGLEGIWVCVLRGDIDGRDFGVVRVSARALGKGRCRERCHRRSWGGGEGAAVLGFLRCSIFLRAEGSGIRGLGDTSCQGSP